MVGLLVGRIVVWGYLIWGGRLPLRVTFPLLICEFLILIVLLIRDYRKEEKKLCRRILFLMCLVLIGCLCYDAGKYQYYLIRDTKCWQEEYIEGLVDIQNYCDDHEENRFLLDCISSAAYTGSVFETRIYGKQNYLLTGSWFTNSPVMKAALREYLLGQEKNIYLIVSDDGTLEKHYTVEYLAEKLGMHSKLVDFFRFQMEKTIWFGILKNRNW